METVQIVAVRPSASGKTNILTVSQERLITFASDAPWITGSVRPIQREVRGFALAYPEDINAVTGKPYAVGDVVEGKVVVLESTTPYQPGQMPKVNPSAPGVMKDAAGKLVSWPDSAVMRHGGKPVYRIAVFSADQNAADALLVSDRAALAGGRVSGLRQA